MDIKQVPLVKVGKRGVVKREDIPAAPAYLVFHDAFDNGAMDVYPVVSLQRAEELAAIQQEKLDMNGADSCGIWRAYAKLPRRKIWSCHSEVLS